MAANMTTRDRNPALAQNTWSDIAPIALEQRFMFDAAGAATGAEAAQDAAAEAEAESAHAESSTDTDDQASASGATGDVGSGEIASSERREIFVVDKGVSGWEALQSAVPEGAEIVLIDPSGDGLAQLASYLDGQQDIDAIHILSHGGAAQITLGSLTLDTDTALARQGELDIIGKALSVDGDILLYGCATGDGDRGDGFINTLATLTGADVAASTDTTGAVTQGGNWVLETVSSQGAIETQAFSTADFQGALSTITFDNVTQNGDFAVIVEEQGVRIDVTTDGAASPFVQADASGLGGSTGNIIGDTSLTGLTSVTFAFDVAVDVSSILLVEFGDQTTGNYIFTSNDSQTYNVGADTSTAPDGTHRITATPNFTNITSFTVTYNSGGQFTPLFDNLVFEVASTNEAPTIDSAINLPVVSEDATNPPGSSISSLVTVTDNEDGSTLSGIAVIANAANASTEGVWQYSSDGTNWADIGTVNDVAGALALSASTSLRFVPAENFAGTPTALTIRALDSTHSGYSTTTGGTETRQTVNTSVPGGSSAISAGSDTIGVSVTAANDDPTASGVPASITVTEDTASNVDLSAITISDVDSASSSITVTIAADSGTLTASSGGGVTIGGSATGTLTLTGTVANIDTFLNTASNIQYTGTSNTSGNSAATLTITANDGGNTGTGGGGNVTLGTVAVNITAFNDDPTATGVPASITVTEDTAGNVDLSAITLSDVDAGSSSITVTIAASAGTLVASSGGGVTVGGSSSGTLTLTGTVANINTYLNTASNIQYTGASNASGNSAATLTITANDGGNTGTGGGGNITLGTVAVNITGVNDNPTGASMPASVSVTEDTLSNVNLSTVTFADVDGDTLTVTLTVSAGTFATPADGSSVGSGVTATLVNATTVTLVGSSADINTYLDDSSRVRYTPDSNATGNNVATITATVNDGNGSGDVAAGTTQINVTAVNDAPAFSGLNDTPSFAEGGSAVVLDGDVTISDVELGSLGGGNGNFAGASLVLVRNGGANASDVFSMVDGGNLTLNGSNIESGGNVIGSFDTSVAGQLTISFHTNPSTTALVNEVMQAIRYSNSSNDPASSVQIDWTFSDGNAGNAQGTGDNPATATGSTTVSITNVNDAPTLSATGGNPTYVEGAGGSDLFNTVTASTIEAADRFSAMTMTVTNVSDGASEIIRFDGSDIALTDGNSVLSTVNNGLNVSVSVSGSTATISFAGASLTNAQMQTLVDGLTYRNSSDNPTTAGNRVVTITGITDNGGGSNSAAPNLTSTVSLTGVNDAPVMGNISGDNSALQPGNTANIDKDGNFTLSNPDSTDYNGGSLVITPAGGNSANGNFSLDGTNATSGGDGTIAAGETISVGGVAIGTVDVTNDGQGGNTLTITFNADATDARIQTLVHNIQWSASAGSGAQSFDLVVNDGDGTADGGVEEASATFTMTLGNPPSIAGLGGDSVNFAEGDSAVVLDTNGDLTITDVDSPTSYNGGNLTVTVSGNAQAGEDILTLVTTGNVSLAGSNVSVDGTVIGTLANTIAAGNDLVINFNSNATAARVQDLARAVAYLNESQSPTESTRSISMTLTDNDGLASTSVVSSVVVSAVNDAPLANGGTTTITVGEDTASNFDLSAITISDVDNTTLTVTITASAGTFAASTSGGVTIGGSGTGTITLQGTTANINTYLDTASNIKYTGAANANGTAAATYTIHANDGTANPQIGGGNIDITAVNDAPVIANLSGDSVNYTSGQTVQLDVGQNALVSDVDTANFNGGSLTVSITAGGTASEDILSLVTSGTNITLSGTTTGSTVSVGGFDVGKLGNAIAAGNDLVINFDESDATPARVQELVRAVSYQNSAGTPTFANRTVSFTLSDGSDSSSVNSTVVVAQPTTPTDTPPPPPPPPPAPPPAPVVTIPPILQTPGSGGDAGTPVSSALSGGSNASGSGGQFNSGGPIRTTVTGQLGSTSPIDNTGTPVSTGLSVNQAGSGLGVTTGLGGNGGGAGLTGGLGGGGFGGGGFGGSAGGGLGGGSAFGSGAGGETGTGIPVGNDGILGAPSTGGEAPGGGDADPPTGEGGGDQAMIDGNGEAELATALEDFSAQLAAFGDAAEMETMLLDQVLGTYRIPA